MEALLAQVIDWVKDNPNWSLIVGLRDLHLRVPGHRRALRPRGHDDGDHGGPDRRRGHRLLAGRHRRRARGHRRRRPELLARTLLQGRHPPLLALQPLPGDPELRGTLLRQVGLAEHRLRALRGPGAAGDPGRGGDDGHDPDPLHRRQRHLRPALGPRLHHSLASWWGPRCNWRRSPPSASPSCSWGCSGRSGWQAGWFGGPSNWSARGPAPGSRPCCTGARSTPRPARWPAPWPTPATRTPAPSPPWPGSSPWGWPCSAWPRA